MTDEAPRVKKAVDFAIASTTMRGAQAYLQRGRRLETLTEPELRAEHVKAFRAFARAPLDAGVQTAHSDVEAEHQLRGLECDYSALGPETEVITSAAGAIVEALPADQREIFGAEIIQDYERAERSKN